MEWEFWTNSNDQCGALCDVQKQFIKEFVPVAKVGVQPSARMRVGWGGVGRVLGMFPGRGPESQFADTPASSLPCVALSIPTTHTRAQEFDSNGWTAFTPHYLVWDCPTGYTESEECQSLCIRHGRYCAPDPDGDVWEGYSGAQVVEENLRSLCVHRLAERAQRAHLWWDYVTRYGMACDMKSGRYGVDCAEEVSGQFSWRGRVCGGRGRTKGGGSRCPYLCVPLVDW